jgi:pyrroloquinoline quinone (PQQ) biosynthesis protein C
VSTATRTSEDQTADGLFARLDASIGELWAGAERRPFWGRIVREGWDRDAYRRTMSQIFHYTRHNSVNQAAAALRADPDDLPLLRFIYGHAKEELGHERMALHDLKSAGLVGEGETVDPPLPATDALVNYLYGVALRDGPVPRLGYSYWAESVYPHIAPLLRAARSSLGLADRDMTFFVAHAEVDAGHAEQVRAAIRRAAITPARAEAIHRVAVTSLWLTIALLEQAVGS